MRPLISTVLLTVALSSLTASTAAARQGAESSVATLDEVKRELLTLANRTISELKAKGIDTTFPFSGTVSDRAAGPVINFLAGQVVEREAYQTLTDLMAVSTATQVGSTPDSTGGTSVAMKGLVPALLGFAVEHGAITKDVNDTVATFRVSPAGIVKALQGEGLLDIYTAYENNAGFRFASRFSASASFDTSLGGSPGTLLADEQQLTAWSITYMFVNRRDPRAKGFASQWRNIGKEHGPALIEARAKLDEALKSWAAFKAWQSALAERVRREVDEPWAKDRDTRAANARFEAILNASLPRLAELSTSDPAVATAMSEYVVRLTAVVGARNNLYEFANKGAIGTFDWTTTRDENLPDLYTLTAVFQNSFTASRKDDFTANAALRFYREAPAGSDRQFKDFNLTAQWDRPLGRVLEIPFAFTAAARYQYIPEDIPVSAAGLVVPQGPELTPAPAAAATPTAIAPKGHLILGQAKLTIPLQDGIRVPLSVTFANRTELIKEKDIRANFGFTFDLDPIVAAFRAR